MKVWVVEYAYDESFSYKLFSTKKKARKFFEEKFEELNKFAEKEVFIKDDLGQTEQECLENMCYRDEEFYGCMVVAKEVEVDTGLGGYYEW